MTSTQAWSSFGELALGFYASGPSAQGVRGDGWYAALSRTPSSELNVCALVPGEVDVAGLLALVGDEQPVIVFTPEPSVEARRVMAENGFEITGTAEPLMRCIERPVPHPSAYSVRRAESEADLNLAVELTSRAHQVDAALLDTTIATAVRAGGATVWLAYDATEPVSTVWLRRHAATLGVMEMMTPPEHQGRGAGRALLTAALAASWSDDVADAILLSTPAGRHLYEGVGFVAVDESLTGYRGLDDDVLDAIGQPR